MAAITLDTRDYVLESLDDSFNDDDIQAIFMRLAVQRGAYWANPNLGSRLYLLLRSKDVPRNILLCKQYADEALADLVSSRFQSITTTATSGGKSRLNLFIEVTRLTGQKQTLLYFVPVGG